MRSPRAASLLRRMQNTPVSISKTSHQDMDDTVTDKIVQQIEESNYISRDLSWLKFNYRVLDQALHLDRSIFDRLKFLSITASNLDEFCTIRLGSLYNYIDYSKERFDYNGLREEPFRKLLLGETRRFYNDHIEYYINHLKPLFHENGFCICEHSALSAE